MRTYLVVTITCPDRPGIVEQITEALVGFSANWEESRMAHLAGRFTGILDVTLPEARVTALTHALGTLAQDGVRILVDTGDRRT